MQLKHKFILKLVIFFIQNSSDKIPRDCAGRTPLHFAACYGKIEICQFIIADLNDKNPKNKDGVTPVTPLYLAANCFGYLEICKLIIKNIQDKNPTDLDGQTPLEIAAKKGQLEMCKLLMSNVEVKNQYSVARDTFNRSNGWSEMDNTVDPAIDLARKHMEVLKYLQTYFENSVPSNVAGPVKRFKSLKGHPL